MTTNNSAPPQVETLLDLVLLNACTKPEKTAFRQLDADGNLVDSVTYYEFAQRIMTCAKELEPKVTPGTNVLIALKQGIDYITAIFSVLFLGASSIPFMPMSARGRAKLDAILLVANPALVIHDDAFRDGEWNGLVTRTAYFSTAKNEFNAGALDFTQRRPSKIGDIAIIQFTSGSTANPKAVCLSHGAVLANEAALAAASGTTAKSHVVCWMPMHHDMALIGNVLQSFYLGATNTILSPLHVMQRPERWLRAIAAAGSDVRSGGPNFIYNWCIDKIDDRAMLGIDLSNWNLAFNGAEMIRRETLNRFSNKFSRFGFNADAFFPCYGMAEGSVFVTGIRDSSQNDMQRYVSEGVSTPFVACGSASEWGEIRIVHPEHGTEISDHEVGEIWVNTKGLASGYLRSDGSIDRSDFSHFLDACDTPFYRTGDEGFIAHGRLYVSGRRADVLKIRGVSIYATDLELFVSKSLNLPTETVAAIAVQEESIEKSIILIEAEKNWQDLPNGVDLVKAQVLKVYGIVLSEVLTVRRNSLSKTSSGKLMRKELAAQFQSSQLKLASSK